MKRLITYFSTPNALSLVIGSTLDRLWSDIDPLKSRKFLSILALLLTLGSGNAWGADSGLTASPGVFIFDFYNSEKRTTTSGTNLNTTNCREHVKVPTGISTSDVISSVSITNNVRYDMNGGLTLGKGSNQDSHADISIGSNFPIRKITVVGTLYGTDAAPLYVAGTSITLNAKQSTYASCSSSTTITPTPYITTININNNSKKRSTLYTAVCEYGYRAYLTTPAEGAIAATPKTANENGADWNSDTVAVVGLKSGQKVTLSVTSSPSGKVFSSWTIKKKSDNTDITASVLAGNELTMPAYDVKVSVNWASSGTSVSLSKAATTNGSFTLSPASSVTTTSSAQTVTVTCTPDAGYYVSAISATNPATCPSAITYGGSNNSRTVTYPTGANGSSTISVTFSPIWELSYGVWGGSWGDPVTMTVADGVASCTLSLSAMTKYGFKFHNAQTNTWYGNSGGVVITDISNWEFPTDGMNCRLFTGPSGNYTFSWTIASSRGAVSYPSVSHPSTGYAYFKKQGSDTYIKVYTHHNSSACEVADWEGSVQVNNIANICNNDYFYFALTDAGGCSKAIIRYNNASSQQGDFTITSHPYSGKWASVDDTNWHEFTTYTISYDKGTGTGGSMSSHTDLCPGSNQALSANAFTKDHYHFTGWTANVDVKIGGSTVTAGTLITGTPTIENVQSNITLTAQWEVNSNTLTWNWGGGSTTSTTYTLYPATSGSVNYNAAITKPANGTMSKTGYNFSSWSSSATSMPDNALTITASWTAKTYSNTLEREGGTTGSTSVTTTYNSSTLTGYTAPTKTGYTFGGYWSGDDGTGTEVIGTNGALKASVTVSAVAWTNSSSQWVKDGAVTMYAKWTAKNYTVTLNDGSGSGGDGTVSVTYDSNTNISDVTKPTYAGYDFRGYYTAADGGGTQVINGNGVWKTGTSYVDGSGNWIYDGSPTLYAYWTAYTYENYRTSCSDMYNIVLDDGLVATTNNGSAKVADNGTTLTSIVAPTKNGYDIEGYYTTSGLNTKIATPTGALSASITVSGDAWTDGDSKWVLGTGATFYTKWTAHEYTITYEGLEGASNTNPTSYNIETTTFALANPGSRTGYTFSGWTLGGTPITQITVGSTGDKTITANWTLNQHTVAVSAADHVVITATPAGGAAIGESGSNTNVDYNKTITLGCTPDDHWNLAWDVYKTGESSTKVAVTGSGDGATFTMPDYNVTVTAVMTEDTYHTATFKNNGIAIDGYDGVKTYDGTKPSAPTLTDVTDACDKTDCNKFYGWIAEDAIWSKTINSVAGKTIYRRAADIPNVSGADVVYHAVWAKGTGVSIDNTLIAKWDKQSLTAGSAVKAKDKDGNTLNDVTMTMSNVSLSSSTGVYGYSNNSISGYPVITISGLDFSSYDGGTITFFARASTAGGELTAEYSTDNGVSFSDLSWSDYTAKTEYGYLISVSSSTTDVRISYSSNSGNFYFGTVRVYGDTDTDYDFTELTSSNTSGWSGADWDGYYLITAYYDSESTNVALRSDVMEGQYGLSNVAPSTGVISTDDVGLIFKVTYNSSTSKYAIQSVATLDYLSDNAGGVSEKFHLLETSETGNDAITYNDITLTTGYYLRWNSSTKDRFGSYTSGTNPTLYKALDSYTEFRITCCDKEITIGTPTKTGSGTVTFASGGDPVDAGGTVETCEGETTITATVTPTNGYQCTALGFSGGSVSVSPTIPEPFVPYTAATAYTLTFDQNTDATLSTTVTFTALVDHYIDNMHYNTTINKSGGYGDGKAPTLSDETKGEQCTGLHYRFIGWIPEIDMNMETGVPTTTANMVAGGQTGMYATGTNYYAIWAEEE